MAMDGSDSKDLERFDDEAHAGNRQFVTALARGLELLRCFGPGEREVGITELARRTGIPKPTVARLAGTLAELGYLDYLPSQGKYRLGPGVLSLGYAMLSNLDVREVARPMMRELAEQSQTSVSIGMRDRLSLVYVETIRSSASITLQRGIGTRLPLATTAMGRAYLAGLPDAERSLLMDQIRLRNEQDWPALKAGIEQGLRDYAERGFCVSVGDWDKDTCGVGVPFRAPDGVMMAFNCGVAAFKFTPERLASEIGPSLVNMVKKVSGSMGRI